LKLKLYSPSQLQVVKGTELLLSGMAVLELMRAVLERGVSFRFKARGWSMTPFIQDGDVITVAPYKKNFNLKNGDVVAFVSPVEGRLMVHRLIAKVEHGFLIRGDGVDVNETMTIHRDNILGRVVKHDRKGHRIKLGLGPERVIIAWLSRMGFLNAVSQKLASCKRKILGRTSQP
jgi:signal peptidase I